MSEFVGGEPISVSVDEPITFENKTDTAFDVDCGIVFRKSGLYRVSIDGRHVSVAVEPERKRGKWIHGREVSREMIGDAVTAIFYEGWECSECHALVEDEREPLWKFCPNCGVDMRGGEQDEI